MKHNIEIIVVIDDEGNWNTTGWGNVIRGRHESWGELISHAREPLEGDRERIYVIKTQIELPKIGDEQQVTAQEITNDSPR